MHWESASAFFAMGGHGFWVWLAWGAALAALVIETVSIRVSRGLVLADIRRRARAEDEADEEDEEE